MMAKACSSAFRWIPMNGIVCRPPKGGTASLLILIALLALSLPTRAAQIQKSQLFLSAQAAYDAGRFAEAAALYSGLATNGIDNVELHYNLANAFFKSGDLPQAVLHYRMAWYKAPHDPDISANLHFALSAVGAADPVPSLFERLFSTLSQDKWIIWAAGGYVACSLFLLLGILIRPARRAWVKASLVPAAVVLLAVGGWYAWQQLLVANPEWVVVKSGATALFGPVEGSTAHYKIPLGALVRQRDVDPKGWLEIEYDGKKGWLEKSYVKRVYP